MYIVSVLIHTEIKCAAPSPMDNAYVYYESVALRSISTYKCNDRYGFSDESIESFNMTCVMIQGSCYPEWDPVPSITCECRSKSYK